MYTSFNIYNVLKANDITRQIEWCVLIFSKRSFKEQVRSSAK